VVLLAIYGAGICPLLLTNSLVLDAILVSHMAGSCYEEGRECNAEVLAAATAARLTEESCNGCTQCHSSTCKP